MRIFISLEAHDYSEDCITITESRIVRHAHVVRIQKNERVIIQSGNIRYYGRVEELSKKSLIMMKEKIEERPNASKRRVSMAISLPNTGAKIDFITEKLTEVGVDKVFFFPAERSQIRKIDQKKIEKLSLKALESSEQSNRRIVPEIFYKKSIQDILEIDSKKCLFDQTGSGDLTGNENIMGIVGPEGGWSEKEFLLMKEIDCLGLGEHILRMETAAIVGGWKLSSV